MEQKLLTELFRLTCTHSYFPNGIGGLFEMEPTEECRKNLRSYRLSFKRKKDGFVIIATHKPKTENGLELVQPFADNVKLSFAIFTNNTRFFEYSELPEDPPGEIVYYYNNLDESENRTLVLGGIGGVTEVDRVKTHTKRFALPKNNADTTQVYDIHGVLIPKIEYDMEIDLIKNEYIVDLSRKPDGFYYIESGGITQAYYCLKASYIRRIPLVIIDIFVGPSVPQAYQVVNRTEDGTQYISPKKFELKFGSSQVSDELYWRYKIKLINVSYHAWFSVKTEDENSFIPKKARVNWDHDPLIFTSEQMISKSDDDIEPALYKVKWWNYCHCHHYPKYKYCDSHYGHHHQGEFRCRHYYLNHGKKYYPHHCPARCDDHFVGSLPRPDEIPTEYYIEDDKSYAEMEMYLIYHAGGFYLSETDDGCNDDD